MKVFGRTTMMGVLSNRIGRDELEPGDHIYSWRYSYLYAHHGIYVGNGNVIHFTRGAGQQIGTGTILDRFLISSSPSNSSRTPCPICGDQSDKDGVISSCLECFLSDGELYQFQYGVSPAIFLAKARGGTCTLAPSDPPEDVIYRAEYLLQNGYGGYNIFRNNCEDFAIYCKTGLLIFTTAKTGRIGQAPSFLDAARAIVPLPPSGQAASFLAAARAIVPSPPSGQAASFLAAASAILPSPLRFMTTGFAGLTVVRCSMYCVSRIFSDIGVRSDVLKIPVEMLVSSASLNEAEAETETPKKEQSFWVRVVSNCINGQLGISLK